MIERWELLAYSPDYPAGRGYVLRLHDDAGRTGLGEARALAGFGSGPAALDAFLASQGAIDSLLDLAADDAATPVEARFAMETALADLTAQRQGVALVEQIGFSKPDELANSVLIGSEAEALPLLQAGHRNFKLKAQGAARATQALLLRLHVDSDGTAQVRIDANGSWDRDTALAFLEEAPRGLISFVEQPFPIGDLDSCAWLANRTAVPIALDEGVVTSDDIADAARAGAASLVVIKPMYRGLHASLRLAGAAADAGLGICVTHAMDGTVGRLAAMHVAAAAQTICPDSSWPHGLYAPGLARLADEPEIMGDHLRMPAGTGLGCTGLRLEHLEPVCASA